MNQELNQALGVSAEGPCTPSHQEELNIYTRVIQWTKYLQMSAQNLCHYIVHSVSENRGGKICFSWAAREARTGG